MEEFIVKNEDEPTGVRLSNSGGFTDLMVSTMGFRDLYRPTEPRNQLIIRRGKKRLCIGMSLLSAMVACISWFDNLNCAIFGGLWPLGFPKLLEQLFAVVADDRLNKIALAIFYVAHLVIVTRLHYGTILAYKLATLLIMENFSTLCCERDLRVKLSDTTFYFREAGIWLVITEGVTGVICICWSVTLRDEMFWTDIRNLSRMTNELEQQELMPWLTASLLRLTLLISSLMAISIGAIACLSQVVDSGRVREPMFIYACLLPASDHKGFRESPEWASDAKVMMSFICLYLVSSFAFTIRLLYNNFRQQPILAGLLRRSLRGVFRTKL